MKKGEEDEEGGGGQKGRAMPSGFLRGHKGSQQQAGPALERRIFTTRCPPLELVKPSSDVPQRGRLPGILERRCMLLAPSSSFFFSSSPLPALPFPPPFPSSTRECSASFASSSLFTIRSCDFVLYRMLKFLSLFLTPLLSLSMPLPYPSSRSSKVSPSDHSSSSL